MGNGVYIEVYADVLFLVCLIPEAVSLWLIAVWCQDRSRGKPLRLLGVSALSAALSTVFLIAFRWLPFPVHLLLDLTVQLAVFRLLYGKQNPRRYVEYYILQKVTFLLLGGMLTAGWNRAGRMPDRSFEAEARELGRHAEDGEKLLRLLFGMLAGGGLLYVGLRQLFKKRHLAESLYPVEIVFQGRSCRCMGFLDTGNQLYYKGEVPVVVLERSLAEELGFHMPPETGQEERYRLIPYSSVGKANGILHGFVCDRIIVSGKGQWDGLIAAVAEDALTAGHDYRILLHPSMLSERSHGDKS